MASCVCITPIIHLGGVPIVLSDVIQYRYRNTYLTIEGSNSPYSNRRRSSVFRRLHPYRLICPLSAFIAYFNECQSISNFSNFVYPISVPGEIKWHLVIPLKRMVFGYVWWKKRCTAIGVEMKGRFGATQMVHFLPGWRMKLLQIHADI